MLLKVWWSCSGYHRNARSSKNKCLWLKTVDVHSFAQLTWSTISDSAGWIYFVCKKLRMQSTPHWFEHVIDNLDCICDASCQTCLSNDEINIDLSGYSWRFLISSSYWAWLAILRQSTPANTVHHWMRSIIYTRNSCSSRRIMRFRTHSFHVFLPLVLPQSVHAGVWGTRYSRFLCATCRCPFSVRSGQRVKGRFELAFVWRTPRAPFARSREHYPKRVKNAFWNASQFDGLFLALVKKYLWLNGLH
jgi:hypothetical protein